MHQIEGSREDTATAAVDYCRVHALPYASHAVSPYFLEGTKTFAYEVVLDSEQTGELPSHIVFPVGNGGLLLGAWIGLKELQQAGRLKQMPRLHAVQAFAVSPIASAYAEKAWSAEPGTSTVAGGIAVGAPARKEQVLDALRDTHGVAVSVEDSEMLRWRGLLAGKGGDFRRAYVGGRVRRGRTAGCDGCYRRGGGRAGAGDWVRAEGRYAGLAT